MAFEMAERQEQRITFNNDRTNPSFDRVKPKLDWLHKLKQEIDDDLTLMRDQVEITVHSLPVRILPISDTHLFASQTDIGKVNELLAKLNEPNTYGVIMGDFIEGANPKIVDHINNVEIGFTDQIRAAKRIIKPFIESGKIICMVGTYTGHEGWGDTNLGIDVVQLIADGFQQPDGTDLKVLYNGGRLVINVKGSSEPIILVAYHAPGGGGSDEINPLGAQRNRLWEHVRDRGPVDGVGGGDWHHRAGVSKELVVDLKTGKEKSHILFSNGTTKGNDPNRPDTFLTKMAKGPTLAPGVQLILNQPRTSGGEKNIWASYGYNRGEILYEAAKLWDRTEKQKQTQSLVGEIVEHSKAPRAVFDRKGSRTKIKESRFDVPMFENFTWDIDASNNLPISISFFANTRYSSTSFEKRDREKFLAMLKEVEGNPYKFALVMRHFVDPDVAKMYGREAELDKMIADLSPIASTGRLLGFMASGSLLDHRWKKDVLSAPQRVRRPDKKGKMQTYYEKLRGEGFLPGEYIYRAFDRRVPLYLHQSLMNVDFGNGVKYEIMTLDHLAHSGSSQDPFRGPVQARKMNLAGSDLVVGGHMDGAGFMSIPGVDYIATGWFSEFDSQNKSNSKRVPLGGQSAIFFPRTKLVVPTSTFLEANDQHAALMLLAGLDKEAKAKILNKNGR